MRVSTLIDQLGSELNEDFTYNPIWTRSELLYYLRQVVKDFSRLTFIVDKTTIRLVNGTTGEANAPSDFEHGFYFLFSNEMQDIIPLGDADFISGDWITNSTDTSPEACTIYGQGSNAKIKLIPVPSTVQTYGSGAALTTLYLEDTGAQVWSVNVTSGAFDTATSTETGTSTVVISDGTVYWDVSIDTLGRLITTVSVSTTAEYYFFIDTVTDLPYKLKINTSGELLSSNGAYGVSVQLLLDDIKQTFQVGTGNSNANYGIVSDMYATGVSTTPAHVGRLINSRGVGIYSRTSDDALSMFYKGLIDDVVNEESELFVSDVFIPIIKHGVLSMGYNKECELQDKAKAQLLRQVFELECSLVKNLFQKR